MATSRRERLTQKGATDGGSEMSDPVVGIIMGSKSDWDTMKNAADTLDQLGIPY